MLEEVNANVEEAGFADPVGTEAAAPPVKRRRRGIDRTTVGVAALVTLGAAGIYGMHARTAKSVAFIDKAAAEAASVQTLLLGGRDGLTALARNIEQTRETIETFSSDNSAALASSRPLERDPFEFRPLEPTQLTPQLSVTANQAARDAARARALEAARRLQLQSIMFGSARRSCLVDGKLYFEGQPLGDFTIARISADSISIQNGESKFELRLRK